MQNAISIDVEEYFHVTGLAEAIPQQNWDAIPSRVRIGLDRVLTTLDQTRTKATFFILGWVAERHPDLVNDIASQGHEIGLHGYDHTLIYNQKPETFDADISRALQAVRASYDGPIQGYRAPTFSVREDTLWALDILKKHGFTYDSSIFPFKRKRYGIGNAPLIPYEVSQGLMEFPMSVASLLGKKFPIGGGFFRLYPYALTRWAVQQINAEGRPAMMYLHPWEFDPDQPVVQADWANTFRHRVNLKHTTEKFKRLCEEFEFVPIKEILGQ